MLKILLFQEERRAEVPSKANVAEENDVITVVQQMGTRGSPSRGRIERKDGKREGDTKNTTSK